MRDANCYTCVYRRDVPGDSHVMCVVGNARVVGDPTGIRNGWFVWPFNFDPTWLVSCDKHETEDNGAVPWLAPPARPRKRRSLP